MDDSPDHQGASTYTIIKGWGWGVSPPILSFCEISPLFFEVAINFATFGPAVC